MKRKILSLALACAAGFSAFAHLATEPAVPTGWMRSWWMPRFEQKRALAAKGGYPVVFIGDSITHNWETTGKAAWDKTFAGGDYRALNVGFSGERTEHVLWRLRHGQLDGTDPKAIVLMIGTNNTGQRPAEEESALDTFLGIRAIIEDLDVRFPKAVKIVCPIFPRGATAKDAPRVRNDHVNQALERYVLGERQRTCKDRLITWCDIRGRLTDAEGRLSKETAPDLLHPGLAGYEVWTDCLLPHLDYALGKTAAFPEGKGASVAKTAVDETTLPLTCRPNPKDYWLSGFRRKSGGDPAKFNHRLREKRGEIQANPDCYYDLMIVGDSITDFWERNFGRGASYVALTNRFKTLNVGFGGFHTEDVLWTTWHGGMADGYQCRAISLMIGTNNREDSAEDVVAGIKATIAALRVRQPIAKIVLTSILPWRNTENGNRYNPKNRRVNELVRALADGKTVFYIDLYDRFLNADGTTNEALYADEVHPNEAGYRVWLDVLLPVLEKLIPVCVRECRQD